MRPSVPAPGAEPRSEPAEPETRRNRLEAPCPAPASPRGDPTPPSPVHHLQDPASRVPGSAHGPRSRCRCGFPISLPPGRNPLGGHGARRRPAGQASWGPDGVRMGIRWPWAAQTRSLRALQSSKQTSWNYNSRQPPPSGA